MRQIWKRAVLIAAAAGVLATSTVHAAENPIERPPPSWVAALRVDAVQQGVRPEIFDVAMQNAEILPRVIELDRKQPEKGTFEKYLKGILSPERIKNGRSFYKQHKELLRRVEHEYAVPAPVIVALLGVETHYGRHQGNTDTINALTTLAYEGRRGPYFRKELIAALKILQDGHIDRSEMKGSWAGALGQCQFMPSNFLRLAQDYNSDGKRDIWGSVEDAAASAANYLNQAGWQEGQRWGRAVRLSTAFNKAQIGLEHRKTLDEWRKAGVTLPDGRPLPKSDLYGSIVQPQGKGIRAYLVYDNYRVLMDWNRSTYFATGVGLLADRIAQP